MPKPTMKAALGLALDAETVAFQARLAKADAHAEKASALLGGAAASQSDATASPSDLYKDANEPAAPEAAPIPKVIREAFTIPEAEHPQIEAIRVQMLAGALAVSKSEVLRAGLLLLSEADDEARRAVFERLERVKTGRPKTV